MSKSSKAHTPQEIILRQMRQKSTDELLAIWKKNDKAEKRTALKAVQKVLMERGVKPPQHGRFFLKRPEKITFRTHLSIEECIQRLKSNMPGGFVAFHLLTNKRFSGWVLGHSFEVRCNRYTRTFAPAFSGKFRAQDDGGTVIEGGFWGQWLISVVLVFLLLVLICGAFISPMFLFLALFILVMLFVTVFSGDRKDEGVILNFIESTLAARRV